MRSKEELERMGWRFVLPNSIGWFIAIPPGWAEKDGQACPDEGDALQWANTVTDHHGLDTPAGQAILGPWYLQMLSRREHQTNTRMSNPFRKLAEAEWNRIGCGICGKTPVVGYIDEPGDRRDAIVVCEEHYKPPEREHQT